MQALATPARAQWDALTSGTNASLRGLSVVDDSVVWASGQRGTVIRTIDGGNTWSAVSIPGAEAFDIRAVHGRSATIAHAAATAGRIWRTIDGGKSWSVRYEASDTSVFLDAIAFFDDRHGLALGDPMGGRFLILVTRDGGDTWSEAPAESRPAAVDGEAAFAASGTSLVTIRAGHAWLGTGGTAARLHRSTDSGRSWRHFPTPIIAGSASTGIFSVAFADTSTGLATGGDYQKPDSSRANGAFTLDGGATWLASSVPPRGYRSGVTIRRGGADVIGIAVGTSGSDITFDGGRTWSALDSAGFNSVQFAPGGVAFAVGGAGRAARSTAGLEPSRRRP
jgi:photosystem II stability/assembly factor-like uncharacterized protein